MPWSAIRLGCRVEDVFAPEPPETGAAVAAVMDGELDALLHLYMLNHGILMTPCHMIALMSAATTERDIDRHTQPPTMRARS